MPDVAIEGLQELINKLDGLATPEQSKALQNGIRKAMEPVKRSAVKNAKELDDKNSDEKIYKNIKVKKWRTKKGRSYLGSSVGVDKKGPGGDTFYWWFLELGTKDHESKRGKKIAGVKPKKFLTRALESNKNEVLRIAVEASKEFIGKLEK